MKHFTYYILFMAATIFASCGGGRSASSLPQGDTLQMQYATHLQIIRYPQFTKIVLVHPSDSDKVLHTYLLIPQSKPLPASLPEGTVVRTPVRNALVNSSVYCSLLTSLGCDSLIGGVCDSQYILQQKMVNRLKQGTIKDCGNGMNPDMERIIELNPDLIMLSFFESSTSYGKLKQLGTPIVDCADYLETSALGRAEWMRFYGRLFGCDRQADALFDQVAKSYNEQKKRVAKVKHRPLLLVDTRYGASWSMPGMNSTTGRIYRDAGAELPFPELKQSGSIPLSSEQVFERAHQAKVWLMKYNQPTDKTLASLKEEDEMYSQFDAYKKGEVYGCNTHHIPFYEETPFQPHLLLADLIQLFHPELGHNQKLHYFCKLKP